MSESLFAEPPDVTRIEMRKPCGKCGGTDGDIRPRGAQDCVYCSGCGAFQYNAPRTETGRAVRTVTTVHNGIKPKQRARILMRDGGRCFLCGATEDLHAGHCVSVESGLALGMTEVDLNDDENLVAMCAACNLGLGKEPLPVRFVVRALMVRLRKAGK